MARFWTMYAGTTSRRILLSVLLSFFTNSLLAQSTLQNELLARSFAAKKAGRLDEASLWQNLSLLKCVTVPVAQLTPQSASALLETCPVEQLSSGSDRARLAFSSGNFEQAETYARELLAAVPKLPTYRDQGRFAYYGNEVTGQLQILRGDVDGAKRSLLAAGKTVGDPVLKSFGPNLLLAYKLLQLGERETVLKFLDECADGFWQFRAQEIRGWQSTIAQGTIPNFGYNLTAW